MATFKQISTWLNNVVVPNSEGLTTTVAEDLSNVADYGKSVNNLTGEEFLDFQRRLAVGVCRTIWDTVIYKHKDYGVFKDSIEYGGALQRIKATDFYDADDTSIVNLVNGVNYFDGTYHGDKLESKIFETTGGYSFTYSLQDVENQKQRFTNIEGVTAYFAEVETNVQNSIEFYLECEQKRQILTVIDAKLSATTPVKVSLITLFNAEFNTNYSDIESIKAAGVDVYRSFYAFARSIVKRVKTGMTEPSKRYNDGTVISWTPEEKIRGIMLSQFATEIDYMSLANTFNPDYVSDAVNFVEVECWQNPSASLVDNYGVSAQVVTTNGTYNNVVAVLYDTDVTGIMETLTKVTTQYIGGVGDYTNFTHNHVTKKYTDLRLNAVVFTLD